MKGRDNKFNLKSECKLPLSIESKAVCGENTAIWFSIHSTIIFSFHEFK